MASIELRGPYQYRAKIRRNGVSLSETFESRTEAENWARITEGKITGDEFVDRRTARDTTLSQACAWMLNGHIGSHPDAKNVASKLRYWKESELKNWSLAAVHDWDLISWRRTVLDEDNAEDGESVGADAEVGPQTVIHRLNALSNLFQTWSRAHKISLENPVKRGVRPSQPRGRNRRLYPEEEARLLAAAERSSRSWLRAAIVIAIETCMRQTELATLTWGRVRLKEVYPHCDLPNTKNDRARRIPLSRKAREAFVSIKPENVRASDGVFSIETGRGIIHAFRDAVDDKSFPDLRWHDLRHEAISRLFELTDLRENEIMAISGHLTPAMLTRYTHLRSDRLGPRLPGER
jgi:integrase